LIFKILSKVAHARATASFYLSSFSTKSFTFRISGFVMKEKVTWKTETNNFGFQNGDFAQIFLL